MRQLKRSLRDGKDVTEAVYDAGFGSSSRVYERADTRLGMTPMQYRRGGQGVAITYAAAASAFGLLMIGATDRGICFVQFGESEEELSAALRREYPAAQIVAMERPHPPQFAQWIAALMRHLEGNQPRLDLPLDIRATAFQMRVWNYLQSIPYGEVQSYGEVAAAIGSPSAVRAVARACASNTVAVAIPCHRVIRGTGELGGYRWGLDRKRALIDLERQRRAPEAVDRGIDHQLQQERGEDAADHRRGDALHHVGARARGPHDRHQAHEHRRHGHELRPDALHGAVHDRLLQIAAACAGGPARRRFVVGEVEIEQHEDAGLGVHAHQRDQPHPHADAHVVAEQVQQPDRADGRERHRQQDDQRLRRATACSGRAAGRSRNSVSGSTIFSRSRTRSIASYWPLQASA